MHVASRDTQLWVRRGARNGNELIYWPYPELEIAFDRIAFSSNLIDWIFHDRSEHIHMTWRRRAPCESLAKVHSLLQALVGCVDHFSFDIAERGSHMALVCEKFNLRFLNGGVQPPMLREGFVSVRADVVEVAPGFVEFDLWDQTTSYRRETDICKMEARATGSLIFLIFATF